MDRPAASKAETAAASAQTDRPARAAVPSFGPARRVRAFEDIAVQIRAELAKGRYKAGQRLASERELCEQFQVSRNTLREALRSLENAGILESRKGASGGAYVAQITGQAMVTGLTDMYEMGAIEPRELIQSRIWIESTVVRVAVGLIRDDEIQALSHNVESAAAATRDGDFVERVRLHLEFHLMVARATRNSVMVTIMQALLTASQQLILRVGSYDGGFIVTSRRRFLKHLAARDVDAAVGEMERQLRRCQRIYVQRLSGGG